MKIMTNEMFLKKNPNYEIQKLKVPNYATTLKEYIFLSKAWN